MVRSGGGRSGQTKSSRGMCLSGDRQNPEQTPACCHTGQYPADPHAKERRCHDMPEGSPRYPLLCDITSEGLLRASSFKGLSPGNKPDCPIVFDLGWICENHAKVWDERGCTWGRLDAM